MAKEFQIDNTQVLRQRMVLVWELVNELIKAGPVLVNIAEMGKTRIMESKYHAMIGDIHKQCFRGNTAEGVKAVLVNHFAKELEEMGEPLRNPGERVWDWKYQEWVTVRPSTKKFTRAEGAKFIEWLYVLGTELNVRWSEPSMRAYEEYAKEAA